MNFIKDIFLRTRMMTSHSECSINSMQKSSNAISVVEHQCSIRWGRGILAFQNQKLESVDD